jgi:hypothetical protein
LLLCARRLYERLGLSPTTALLAMLIVAFDNGALVPVGWLSNRNSLLEGLFTVLALLAGLRAVEGPSPWRVALALWLAGAALASKESGLCAFAALALLFLAARARAAVAACGLVVLAYLAVYVALGYGSNTSFYPTPWGDPVKFGARTLQLLVCAPLAAATPLPLDALAHQPQLKVYFLSAAVLLGAPLLYVFVRKLRGQPRVNFLLLWGLFALLPQAGAPPSDRLMFTPMLAWAPLLAMFVVGSWTSSAPRAGERRDAWIVAASMLLLSPLALVGAGLAMGRGSALLRTVIARADVGEDLLGTRHAFLLQASPTSLLALGPLATWLFEGGSEDVRFYPMQGGQRALRWTRTSDSSFALESLDEPFLTHMMEQVFLTRAPAMDSARTWRLGALHVRGAPEAGGELRRIEVDVGLSLDDLRCRFLFFDGENLVHRAPPGLGESVELPRGARDPFLP